MSGVKKRVGSHGDFGKETPPLTETKSDIHMWFAAWHMDHGHTVEETEQFVNTLRRLKWTPSKVRLMSIEKLVYDLHSCGYQHAWAARFAGDMQRGIALKDVKLESSAKTPFQSVPDLIIRPNRHFIHNTPPVSATHAEIRTWLKLWFTHRPEDVEFMQFTTKFDYQCPLSLIEEVEWDGDDILFFTKPHLKKTILGKYIRAAYINALAGDIREVRREMRVDLTSADIKDRKKQFDSRAANSA